MFALLSPLDPLQGNNLAVEWLTADQLVVI
jgi:hypothetical protein